MTCLLTDFAAVWSEVFPPSRRAIVQLLVERVTVRPDGLEMRLRVEGLASLIDDLRRREDPEVAAA